MGATQVPTGKNHTQMAERLDRAQADGHVDRTQMAERLDRAQADGHVDHTQMAERLDRARAGSPWRK